MITEEEKISEIEFLRERLSAQENMLSMTSAYLNDLRNRLEKKNKEILSSIEYARRLQEAILPSEQLLKEFFDEAFIFLRQRDRIGGDFPFIYRNRKYVYVAAIDCTGHGVPGALLTMLCHTILNNVLHRFPDLTPGQVITKLDRHLSRVLNRQKSGMSDGVDMALIRVDAEKNELLYSAIGRPLYVLHTDLEIIKASRSPFMNNTSRIFTDTSIDIQSVDQLKIYLFSDGITDQFGGKESKKFSNKRLRDILHSTIHLNLEEQKEEVLTSLENWQGDETQTDDMLLIGIKLK